MERDLEDGRGCGMAGSLAVVSPSDVEGSDFSIEASVYLIWVPVSPQWWPPCHGVAVLMESAQAFSWGKCERPPSPRNESIQLGSVSGTDDNNNSGSGAALLLSTYSAQGAMPRQLTP